MPRLSINELATLTGKTRATVTKRLDGIDPAEDKGKVGKLYDSKIALEKIYLAANESGGEFISSAEAQRQLTIARKEQIDLETACTRKERISLDVLEETNDEIFSNVAGILKAHEGKKLSSESIGDMLSELRRIGEFITKKAR